uniref:ATP synthase complex subunit 8 n=1 Tax=Curculio davidi TaxID=1453177 RepID=A0A1S7C7T7_9CUCU|nr:ATP synthase F0 subunit 8 [Curculio davidi]AQX92155.1 ATP synthase F0 subunit 8 [Curculio davidi]
MPQMAPMSWLTLYFIFIMIFVLMIIMNYYSFLYSTNNNFTKKTNKKLINWKW